MFVISKGHLGIDTGSNDNGKCGVLLDSFNKKAEGGYDGETVAFLWGAYEDNGSGGNNGILKVDGSKTTYLDESKTVYRFEMLTEIKEYIIANSVDLNGFGSDFLNTTDSIPQWK